MLVPLRSVGEDADKWSEWGLLSIGSFCDTGRNVSIAIWSDLVLEFCEGPAGILQLPSRDDLDVADSVVSDESLELTS